MSFKIVTEITSDLTDEYALKHDVTFLKLKCYIDEEEVGYFESKYIYQKMREGKLPTTSMLTKEEIIKEIEPLLINGYDVLYIVFSSALSGTYQSACLARDELNKKCSNKLYIVDSKSASSGEGLMVDYAVELRDKGKSIQEIVDILEAEKMEFCHYFTVESLFHLNRGGRVSKLSAIIGSVVQLKPVLHVDMEGRLISIEKVIGRKKSLKCLVDLMEEKCRDNVPSKVFISHGDASEDAEFVARLIRERFNIKDITINFIDPVIGAHAGPGTIALFFKSKKLR